jgi:hypothetical protein
LKGKTLSDHDERQRAQKKRHALSLTDAADQACEYFGFLSYEELDLGDNGEPLKIPNPQLLPPELRKRFDECRMSFEDCDREPDVELPGGGVIKGDYLDPRRRDGELVDPPYEVELAKAIWGEDGYRRFEAAVEKSPTPVGPGIISMVWARMDDQFRQRERNDSKSR